MKYAGRYITTLASLMALALSNSVAAHVLPAAPIFPAHHVVRALVPHSSINAYSTNKALVSLLSKQGLLNARTSLSLSNSQFLAGPGSLATKNFNKLLHTVVENGVANGKFSVPTQVPGTGGSITNGTLQGDLYLPSGPGQYFNLGEFSGNVGNIVASNYASNNGNFYYSANSINPSIQNSLTFSNQGTAVLSNFRLPTGIPPFDGVSGSQKAFRQLFSNVYNKAYTTGQTLGLRSQTIVSGPGGGGITSGVFVGTLYRNNLGTPGFYSYPLGGSPTVIFAFGNTPLNNPAAYTYATGMTVPSSVFPTSSFINFADGYRVSITNGQVLLPLVAGGAIGQQYGYAGTGIFALGANLANNGLANTGPLTNLSSYIFF